MDKSIKQKDHLKKYLWISAIAHFLFFLIFSGGLNFFAEDEIIIPPSIQVDLVAPPTDLPQKPSLPKPAPTTAPEPEPIEPTKELPEKENPKPKEPEGPKVDLEAKKKAEERKNQKKLEAEKKKKIEKKRKQEALKKKQEQDRAKAQQNAINKLKQKEALSKLLKKDDTPKANTGERLNPGNSFSGMDAIQFNKYYGDLKEHLFNNWSLPQWLSELDLKAQALVVIDRDGYVIKKTILKSSGNTNFDNTILGAIDKASPFPVAPERLKMKVENKEIVFGFPQN